MSKKTRIAALLLTFVMLFSVAPLTLLAADGTAAVAEEATEKNALDTLADKATGSPYQMPAYSDFASLINGRTVNEGAFGEDGYSGTGSGGSNNGKESFICTANGGVSFVDKKVIENDVTFSYTANSVNLDLETKDGVTVYTTKYVVFSANIMRGEIANTSGSQYVLRLRLRDDAGNAKEKAVAYFQGENIQVANALGGGFSTSLWTNVTFVYNIEANSLDGYANGIFIGTQTDFLPAPANYFKQFADVSLWYGKTATFNGRFMSVKETRAYLLKDDAAISAIVAADTTPANGVFKIDGDYYLYENNFPVIGATKTVDGYTIVTEAKTGKITDCYKAEADPLYQRWDQAQFTAADVTLKKNGVHGTPSVGGTDFVGYKYISEETVEGTTYYYLEPETSVLNEAWIFTASVDGGRELVKKLSGSTPQYYSAIPNNAVAVTDESGNIVSYKTTEKYKTQGTDVSLYYGLDTTYQTTNVGNVNFRLKAGNGLNTVNTLSFSPVRFRAYYKTNESNTEVKYEVSPGAIRLVNGVHHLFIHEIDCGVFSKDLYTDITFSMYLTEGVLKYDIYVNGLNKGTITAAENVASWRFQDIGCWLGSNLTWENTLLTWGTTQQYYDGKVNNNTAPYTGTYQVSDGYLTFKDGIATSLTKGAVAPDVNGAVIYGYSATLGEKLGLNFYTILPENAATARFTVGDATQTVNISDLTATDGVYKLTAKLSTIEIGKSVMLEILDKDGNIISIEKDNRVYTSYIYSVRDYVDYLVLRQDAYKDESKVAKAMLDYAAYAERYFGTASGFATTYATANLTEVAALDATLIKGTVSAGAGAADILGAVNLVLNDATKIRINLKSAATVTSSYDGVQYVEKDGKYYIDISGIDAKNLDTVYELDVNSITVKISVLGVASVVANSDSYGTDFVNLMKALYLYSNACEAL